MGEAMSRGKEYRFKIDAYTPDTMPMARLAEYMTELSALLGEEASVHFVRLAKGSTVLVHRIDEEAEPKVMDRVHKARQGEGAPEAIAAIKNINRKLREDNGSAVWSRGAKAEIIRFPGKAAEQPVVFAAINQEGSLDGVPILVGGIKEWVPVHLQAGDTIYSTCVATRDVAKQLANYLFEGSVRVYGTGHWYRDEMGAWVLDKFRIRHFEPLNDDPLTTVVAGLRAIPGNEWNDISDPWAELEAIRHGVREQH